MVKINFEEIKYSRQIKGVCRKCGKRRTRTLVETNTISPFNKNPDGTVRSRSQVIENVKIGLEHKIEKLSANFICATCFNNLPWKERDES